jgi:hypothetical protein
MSDPATNDPVTLDLQARFWNAGSGSEALNDPRPFGHENALQKLGRPPFERSSRSKFRLLGFLATVYEHVQEDVAGQNRQADPSGDDHSTAPSDAS